VIFVHALDANDVQIGQIDAAPYDNLYPTSAWRPEQIITDVRQLAAVVTDPSQIRHLAIGIYDPATGARLSARDETGRPLMDNMLRFDVANPPNTLPSVVK
jgi:hypothetical protein